jgi:hypothetical protein
VYDIGPWRVSDPGAVERFYEDRAAAEAVTDDGEPEAGIVYDIGPVPFREAKFEGDTLGSSYVDGPTQQSETSQDVSFDTSSISVEDKLVNRFEEISAVSNTDCRCKGFRKVMRKSADREQALA